MCYVLLHYDLYEHINQYVHIDYIMQPKLLNILKQKVYVTKLRKHGPLNPA